VPAGDKYALQDAGNGLRVLLHSTSRGVPKPLLPSVGKLKSYGNPLLTVVPGEQGAKTVLSVDDVLSLQPSRVPSMPLIMMVNVVIWFT
jgi:hypothetical protein